MNCEENKRKNSNQVLINWIHFKFSKLRLSKEFTQKSYNCDIEGSENNKIKKEIDFKHLEDKIYNDKIFWEIKQRKEKYKNILEKLQKVHVSFHYIPKQEQRNLIYRDALTKEEKEILSLRINNLVTKEKKKRINKIATIHEFSDESIDYSLFDVRKITDKSKTSLRDKIKYLKKNKKENQGKNAKQIKNECERDKNKLLNHIKYLDIN